MEETAPSPEGSESEPVEPKQEKRPVRAFAELILVIGLSLLFAWFIQAFLIKPYLIPSGSMLPNLLVGERILAERVTYRFSDPAVGDVIVFHPPVNVVGEEQSPPFSLPTCPSEALPGQSCPRGGTEPAETTFIKRIVAGPGDRVSLENGIPIVNGEPVGLDWNLNPCTGMDCDYPRPITVPEDHYFVLGDNRGKSEDSRFWGTVPRDWILGQAVASYWPLKEIGPIK